MNEQIDHASRAHALLSASSAARWLACPPSAVAAEAYPDTSTDYTREGTLAHEVAELVARARLNGGSVPETWPEGVNSEMIAYAEAYADYILEHMQEGAIVLLEQRVDFSPWVPGGFGTCDCIIIQDDTLTVIDYKYGKGVAVDAANNPQMMLYALGALNDYGFAYDVEQLQLHIFQPRISNISVDDRWKVDELMAWAESTVKPTAAKALKGKGEYIPGSHCRFCPHAGKCKALTKVCTTYVQAHGMRVKVPTLAPFEVAEVLQMAPLVELWLKRVKDQALTDMLNGEEIPGYKVVAGRGSRSWADDLEVANLLKREGYSQEDITETKLLSVAGMEKALGKKKVAELLGGQILAMTGAPTIAPESDKRPVYDRLAEAKKDYEAAP